MSHIGLGKTLILGTNKDDLINAAAMNPFEEYSIFGFQGNDTLIGGFLSDVIHGNQGNDIILGLLGVDTLYSNEGNDVIFGVADEFIQDSVATPIIMDDADTLYGNSGSDILVGTAGLFVIGETEDNLVTSVTAGGKSLFGGAGNDELYGLSIIGDIFDSNVTGRIVTNFYNANILEGGDGNDSLFGLGGFLTVTLINYQGQVEEFFGEDILLGGNGNDTIIGDIHTGIFNISTDPLMGTIITEGSNIHNYGNDYIDGGRGDDLLIGDYHTLILNVLNSPDWHQEERYGSDTLIGGRGNDTLVGDVFFSEVNTTNPGSGEIFGNDIFQFSLDQRQPFGNDTILDLNAGGVADTFKFTEVRDVNLDGMIDVQDVEDSVVSFSANGNGDVLISFSNGSITADGIAFADQGSLTDLGIVMIAEG